MLELMWATLDLLVQALMLWYTIRVAGLYCGWWKFDNEKREFVRG